MATTADLGRVIGPTGPKGDTGPKGQDLVHVKYVIDNNNRQVYLPTGWYCVVYNRCNSIDMIKIQVKFKRLTSNKQELPTSLVKAWTSTTFIGMLPTPDADMRTYDFIHIVNSDITDAYRIVAYLTDRSNANIETTSVIFTKID